MIPANKSTECEEKGRAIPMREALTKRILKNGNRVEMATI
ncbi:hypothetical protein EDD73_10427 [Heliophilum fasciatum]|uniref:Uncharacterized protein n=1 Tax=Heliophilum fasciatum TaxID=35700 RepID=A0A4R2SA82_9FIRM|nr:hypothetical protein [Heliophilum fasciatum]TCP68125.1 hypothetical protein EDD73_10427 [Heliophilum fasciatum]